MNKLSLWHSEHLTPACVNTISWSQSDINDTSEQGPNWLVTVIQKMTKIEKHQYHETLCIFDIYKKEGHCYDWSNIKYIRHMMYDAILLMLYNICAILFHIIWIPGGSNSLISNQPQKTVSVKLLTNDRKWRKLSILVTLTKKFYELTAAAHL